MTKADYARLENIVQSLGAKIAIPTCDDFMRQLIGKSGVVIVSGEASNGKGVHIVYVAKDSVASSNMSIFNSAISSVESGYLVAILPSDKSGSKPKVKYTKAIVSSNSSFDDWFTYTHEHASTNMSKHCMRSSITIVEDPERVLIDIGAGDKQVLPKISRLDPMLIGYFAEIGDIVKIRVPSMQTGRRTTYRLVIDETE